MAAQAECGGDGRAPVCCWERNRGGRDEERKIATGESESGPGGFVASRWREGEARERLGGSRRWRPPSERVRHRLCLLAEVEDGTAAWWAGLPNGPATGKAR